MLGRKVLIERVMFFLFCCSAFVFITCDLGTQPVGPSVNPDNQVVTIDSTTIVPSDSVTRNMEIFVSPSWLLASNTETARVEVIVYDNLHNPVKGKQVNFATDTGIVSSMDVTDSLGKAHATFLAVPVNAQANVVAWMRVEDSIVAVTKTITLKNLQVRISVNAENVLRNTVVPVTVTVLDGKQLPVSGAAVVMTGTAVTLGTTDGDGIFTTTVSAADQRSVAITASALGSADTAAVRFWNTLPESLFTTQNQNLVMRIFSSKTQMRADNSDSAIITVLLTNKTNNPQSGQRITFSSTLGIISQSAIVDSNGRATAVLRSAPENGVSTVIATAVGTSDSAKTEILFSGVRLQLATSITDLKAGQSVTIEAEVNDGSGNPINGDTVTFIASNGGLFANGDSLFEAALDPNGRAIASLTSATAGNVRVMASALKTSDVIEISFTNNTLTLTPSVSAITVGGSQTATITAAYVDGSGNPVANALIVFATNAGTLTQDSLYTNSSGVAVTTLAAGGFSATATIQANAPNGTAQTTVVFAATAATTVKLAISPDNIGVSGGVATLTATVTDSNGNMVNGANVNFRILKGPGGGEYISKPLVVTNNGNAASQLYAGTQPSQYRGCLVIATTGTVSDTSKLTISGEPYIITVSRPQNDTVTVQKTGFLDESTFQYNIGAVVQDINGNPVADGTNVHFSAFISGMSVGTLVLDYWSGIDAANQEKKAVLAYRFRDIIFEDVNNSRTMNPGIDLMLDGNDAVASRGDDVNGDGVCDYNSSIHDFYWDFSGNGRCDTGVSEPYLIDSRYVVRVTPVIVGTDTTYDTLYNYKVYADLNQNGMWDKTELAVDHNGNGICDLPVSGDFRYGLWEIRDWFSYLKFDQNDFAVVIAASAETKGGVAYARITYPRQFALRLSATVNAEANGIRDRDGERFTLPVIIQK